MYQNFEKVSSTNMEEKEREKGGVMVLVMVSHLVMVSPQK
jgi:hypothetical protein